MVHADVMVGDQSEGSELAALFFKTSRHSYAYDPNTNDFFQLDDAAFSALQALRHGGPDAETRMREPGQDAGALDEIRELQGLGHFQPLRVRSLQPELDFEGYQEALRTKMQQLILSVTERCNLRCSYCIYSGDHSPAYRGPSEQVMPLATALKAVDYFLERSAKTAAKPCVSFYGGEPLLAMDLVRKVVAHVNERRGERAVGFQITTNGTRLTPGFFRFLRDNDFHISVSLDGPGEVHDVNRHFPRGAGSFAMIERNLEQALEIDSNFYRRNVTFLCSIAAPQRLPEIRQFFLSKPYLVGNRVRFHGVHWAAGAKNTDERGDGPDAVAELSKEYDAALAEGRVPDVVLRGLFEEPLRKIHTRPMAPIEEHHHPNGICAPGVQRLFCSSQGRFLPCERVCEELVVGDVESGIDERRAYALTNEYAEGSAPDCSRCWAVRFCSSCFVHAYPNGQFCLEQKRVKCFEVRQRLMTAMVRYWSILERNDKAFDYLSPAPAPAGGGDDPTHDAQGLQRRE